MPTSNGTDAFKPGIALGDNRRLHLGRPLAPLASPRENLEALRPPAHRIITRDYHSSSALPPDQGAKTQRYTSTAQGGHRTALTAFMIFGALEYIDLNHSDDESAAFAIFQETAVLAARAIAP